MKSSTLLKKFLGLFFVTETEDRLPRFFCREKGTSLLDTFFYR